MKYLLWFTILITLQACSTSLTKKNQPLPSKHHTPTYSFHRIWKIISQSPYTTLPQTKVSYSKLSDHNRNIILVDAKRTLMSQADILPSFEKLAHPNGICFEGIWEITQPNPYSGYFKQGTKALIIARASSALSNTHSGEIRSFGFAGKLFPTLHRSKVPKSPTANFFLIDDLGGTRAARYTDVTLTNAPSLSFNSELLKHLFYGLKVNNAFGEADKNPKIRQLYEISYLGTKKHTRVITPRWMKIKASAHLRKAMNGLDFRDELKLGHGRKLVFNISVGSRENAKKKVWKRIGKITLDSAVSSSACDRRLHFHHPAWKEDLQYLP